MRGLPDHALLDRIVRGRAWIPLLGVMLAGIVAMQVEVLKLGASMGRAIEAGSALQSRNELLRANVASLADDQRIERVAAGMGMVMPAPTEVTFLSRRPGNVRRAAANIHQPDGSTFTSSLAALDAAARAVTTPTSSASAPATGSLTGAQAASPAAQIGAQTAAPAVAPSPSAGTTSSGTSGGAPVSTGG